MSIAAALMAPAIGIGAFLMANRDHSAAQPKSISMSPTREEASAIESGQVKDIRTFTPQGRWLGSSATRVQEPKLKAAAVLPSREPNSWHTVVSCPSGGPIPEDGICPLLETVTERSTGKSSMVNLPSEAGNLGSGEIERPAPVPIPRHPGRMSVGGP